MSNRIDSNGNNAVVLPPSNRAQDTTAKVDFLELLPPELTLKVLDNLSFPKLALVSQVSHNYYSLAGDNVLWGSKIHPVLESLPIKEKEGVYKDKNIVGDALPEVNWKEIFVNHRFMPLKSLIEFSKLINHGSVFPKLELCAKPFSAVISEGWDSPLVVAAQIHADLFLRKVAIGLQENIAGCYDDPPMRIDGGVVVDEQYSFGNVPDRVLAGWFFRTSVFYQFEACPDGTPNLLQLFMDNYFKGEIGWKEEIAFGEEPLDSAQQWGWKNSLLQNYVEEVFKYVRNVQAGKKCASIILNHHPEIKWNPERFTGALQRNNEVEYLEMLTKSPKIVFRLEGFDRYFPYSITNGIKDDYVNSLCDHMFSLMKENKTYEGYEALKAYSVKFSTEELMPALYSERPKKRKRIPLWQQSIEDQWLTNVFGLFRDLADLQVKLNPNVHDPENLQKINDIMKNDLQELVEVQGEAERREAINTLASKYKYIPLDVVSKDEVKRKFGYAKSDARTYAQSPCLENRINSFLKEF